MARLTINERLRDTAVDRQINLGRFANSLVRQAITLLNRMDVDLMGRLSALLERLPSDAPSVRRIDSQVTSVRGLVKDAYERVETFVVGELRSLTEYELEYQRELFGRLFQHFPVKIGVAGVDPAQVFAAVRSRPFQGRLLSEWFDSLEDNKAVRVRDAVRMGYAEGQSVSEIVQRLRGTKANGYSDGVVAVDRRHAEAVVRTAVSHTAGTAREVFYDANSDLVDAKVWVSTLDGRTTPACQVRDGLHYDMENRPVGHDVPWLAGPGLIHWNCRSVSAPVTKSFRELGIDLDEFTPAQRASMDGEVPAKTTYTEWLERQSAERQEEIMGATRTKLVREGRLDPARLWDDRGNYLTLDELRERDRAAFERAGL